MSEFRVRGSQRLGASSVSAIRVTEVGIYDFVLVREVMSILEAS